MGKLSLQQPGLANFLEMLVVKIFSSAEHEGGNVSENASIYINSHFFYSSLNVFQPKVPTTGWVIL